MHSKATRLRTLIVAIILSTLTFAAFWPILQNGFVSYDDRDYITENPHVLTGWTMNNVAWAFSTAYAGNWHPLTWLSHMADFALFGLRPAWHHLVSLLLHTANALLLLLWLNTLTRAFWRSAVVAALFALHPMHVESVAWAAERKDVLSAFFFLLTLLAYGRYARKPPTRSSSWYAAALGLFALGLMCKPMLVTVPGVLLLVDFWPLRRLETVPWRRLALEKVPFLTLSLASCVLTFLVQQRAGAVSSLESLPLSFRLCNACISYIRYGLNMLWPAKLAVFYPAPPEWPLAWVLGAAFVIAAATAFALRMLRQTPYLAFGWFWYLGMLVPVVGIVQVGQQALADRYSYLPLIGLFVAIVWSAADLALPWPAIKPLLASGAAATIALCAALTWCQTQHWRDSARLFSHALAVTHDNAIAHNNLGVELLDLGELPAAEAHFREAVRIKSKYPDGLGNLALCRAKQGHLAEAHEFFEQSLNAQPNGSVHYNFANLLLKQGELDQAHTHYLAALQLKPRLIEAWYNLGVLEATRGRPEDATRAYIAALQIKPDYVEAHLSLGAQLAGQRKLDDAVAHFQAALRVGPENPDVRFNLAAALNARGDFAGAASNLWETCRLRPDDVEARANLGLALLYQGKMADAADQFRAVLRSQPNADTHYHLALALDSQGQSQEALTHYREAVGLSPATPLYLNDLAWFLATNPKPELRDPPEAVRLAEQACQSSGGQVARFWGTLDAAYAAAGRFADALSTATKVRAMALASNQPEIARRAEERLALYRAGQPFRAGTTAPSAP